MSVLLDRIELETNARAAVITVAHVVTRRHNACHAMPPCFCKDLNVYRDASLDLKMKTVNRVFHAQTQHACHALDQVLNRACNVKLDLL